MTPFSPNETITIIGFIALVVITLYNIGKMILINAKYQIMGVYDAIRAGNGVINFLNSNEDKIDIGKPKTKSYRQQEIHLNNLLLEFGKQNNIKLLKNNSTKYKGSFSPFMENSKKIQENWNLFKEWIFNNYKINPKLP